MGLSASGIGSGLDVNGIVSQLMAAERTPLNLLKKQESSYKSKLSAYGTLKSAVSAFQTAVKALSSGSSNSLGAQTATVSNPAIMSATAGSTATAGTYSIRVTDLAQAYKITSAGEADIATSFGNGDLTIQVGTGEAVTITPTTHSLQGIRDAINASTAGVTATIINDGTANGNRLVITAKDSGAANAIKITGTADMAKFSYDPAAPVTYASNPDAPMSQLQAGKDAALEIDGISITKPSNVITDAIQGVTLTLTQKTEGTTAINLAIARDTAKVKEAVNNFIKAYNELNKTISTMTAYNPETKVAGALQGDSGAVSVLRQVRGAMIKEVTGAGDLKTLNDIGVSFQKDGTLALKDATFEKALSTNFEGIAKLFTATDGYATKLSTLTTNLLGEEGLIASRTEGLNGTLTSISKRSAAIEQRLISTEKRYRAQFTALDVALSSMQNTAAYMSQQLAALSKSQS